MLTKFYKVTVRRQRVTREGVVSKQSTTRAPRYCRGEDEVFDFMRLVLANKARLKDITTVPISEAEYTKHTHKGY